MQANSTLPKLTPLVSDFKKAFAVAGLGLGALLLAKFSRSTNNNTPKLPQRRLDALTSDFPSLKEASEVDASILGNKGTNLSNLLALGLEVPSGFIISTRVYDEHMIRSGADKLIKEVQESASERRSKGLENNL